VAVLATASVVVLLGAAPAGATTLTGPPEFGCVPEWYAPSGWTIRIDPLPVARDGYYTAWYADVYERVGSTWQRIDNSSEQVFGDSSPGQVGNDGWSFDVPAHSEFCVVAYMDSTDGRGAQYAYARASGLRGRAYARPPVTRASMSG